MYSQNELRVHHQQTQTEKWLQCQQSACITQTDSHHFPEVTKSCSPVNEGKSFLCIESSLSLRLSRLPSVDDVCASKKVNQLTSQLNRRRPCKIDVTLTRMKKKRMCRHIVTGAHHHIYCAYMKDADGKMSGTVHIERYVH